MCKFEQQGGCTKPNCPFKHLKTKSLVTDVLAVALKLVFEKNQSIVIDEAGVVCLNELQKCADLDPVKSSIDFNSKAFCDTLCRVIKDAFGAPQYLQIDGNGVKSLTHFLRAMRECDLHETIKGISAANNQLSTYDFLHDLKSFRSLKELRFVGNPIAARSDYRSHIRTLPQLEGLDGESVERLPLELPWPLRSNEFGEREAQLLQLLEADFFQVVESGGLDRVELLHPSVRFSVSFESDVVIRAPQVSGPSKREIVEDYVRLRQAMEGRNSNLKLPHTRKMVGGRTEALSAMRYSLYPRNFEVHHELDSNADIQIFPDQQYAVATLHGTMQWRHVKQMPSENPVCRIFDRTFVLTFEDRWYVTNDMVRLRHVAPSVLLFPDSESRVIRLGRKYEIELPLLTSIIKSCTSDYELHLAVQDIKQLTPEQVSECFAVANGNDAHAIAVARIACRHHIYPASAYTILQTAHFSLDEVDAIIPTVGPEHRF